MDHADIPTYSLTARPDADYPARQWSHSQGTYQVFAENMELDRLRARFPGKVRIDAYLDFLKKKEASSSVCIANAESPRWADMILWLPGVDDVTLDALAHQTPFLAYLYSMNYMACDTVLVWRAPNGTEMLVSSRVFSGSSGLSLEALGFGVTFMNRTSVRYAAHHLCPQAVDDLMLLLQFSGVYSRDNYRPWRAWDGAFLDAHKDLPCAAPQGLEHVCLYDHLDVFPKLGE